MKPLFYNICFLLACAVPVCGQAIPNSLTTAGTTTTDATGRSWAYVAFTQDNPGVLRGRSLAVYVKNGLPQDSGDFTKQGTVSPELEMPVLSVFLERGRQLGGDMVELDTVLYDIYRTRGLDKNALPNPLPTPVKPPLVEMLASLLNRAVGDVETATALRLLGQSHPAVKMALGEAWATPLAVATGQPVTLEVRESTASGDGGVVGRVTLTAGQPVVLQAPGAPVQVPDLSPKGDLNIKLRWGQNDDLRRQSPLAGGFNVWRVTRPFAAANGVEAAPPSLSQLQTWTTSGDAKRVSPKPVLATKLFYPAEAAVFVPDATTYFVTDDGNRYRKNPLGENIDDPLIEGAEFTYFVTSRDILGRDGPPSSPGHGVVCRTLPPPVPSGLRVENYWRPDENANAVTGTQAFQFFWKANVNNTRDVTHYYEIYRGTDLASLESTANKALLTSIAPNQTHTTDGVVMAYVDEAPEVLTSDFGNTFWFSVRAVHVTPCGPIKSDFSAPVMIARRQREAPAAPSGTASMSCPRAAVISKSVQNVNDLTLPANDELIRIRLLVERKDPGIASVEISIRSGGQVTDLGNHLFGEQADLVAAEFEIADNELVGGDLIATCQATTHTGALSNPKEVTLSHLGPGQHYTVATFEAKTMTDATLSPGEVFSNELLEDHVAAAAYASAEGVGVAIGPASLNGRSVVIQTTPTANAVAVWSTSGYGPVGNSTVYFSTTVLADGQQPPALSARLFAIREFGQPVCANLAFEPSTGKASPIQLQINTTPRTAEYRLFRRVNDGPYTQIGQGKATFLQAAPLNAVRRSDDALPSTSCTICYYAQTVDRDGNASAMVRLGDCIDHRMPVLPKPRLSPPAEAGTLADAKMRLTWACPPEGIEQFLITIEARGAANTLGRLQSTPSITQTTAHPDRDILYFGNDTLAHLETVKQAAGKANQGSNPDSVSSLAIAGQNLKWKKMLTTSRYLTAPLGNGFPSEPPFTLEFNVSPGSNYKVFVQAYSRGVKGPASAMMNFSWKVPNTAPEPAVAWPARPMPAVTTVSGVVAGELHPVLWPAHLNGQRPVGVKLASLPSQGTEDFIAGTDIRYAPRSNGPGFGRSNPNAFVPPPIGNGITQVQGVVLYRQQVANSLFPNVPGDTVQVSPLVRSIAYIPAIEHAGPAARLIDPFFGITYESPNIMIANGGLSYLHLWLLDTQGVVDSARYHYYVVCFSKDGEITQTIDAGFYGPM